MSLEELVGILKMYELEHQQDGLIKKEKSIALKVSKRAPTKALRTYKSL